MVGMLVERIGKKNSSIKHIIYQMKDKRMERNFRPKDAQVHETMS